MCLKQSKAVFTLSSSPPPGCVDPRCVGMPASLLCVCTFLSVSLNTKGKAASEEKVPQRLAQAEGGTS